MENERIIISKMSLINKILIAIKAGASTTPCAGGLASLLSDYQSQKQYKLIEDVLNRFLTMIEKLDERVKNLEYMDSQDLIYDLLQTLDRAKDEQDDYRRNMYARYLTSCCHIENDKNRYKRIFLEYMGKMDELDFFILKTLNVNFIDKNAVDDVTVSFNYKNHSNISQREVMNHFHYLTSLGIIEMPDREEVEKIRNRHHEKSVKTAFKKERIYQRTTLGDDLYDFIIKSADVTIE